MTLSHATSAWQAGPPRDFVGPWTKHWFGALDDVIYVISPRPWGPCLWGPRPPFGAPTLWNFVSLRFKGSNYCSNPTAVRYVTVFNLRYAKNVKLKRFRGPLSRRGPGASCPPLPPSWRPWWQGMKENRTLTPEVSVQISFKSKYFQDFYVDFGSER